MIRIRGRSPIGLLLSLLLLLAASAILLVAGGIAKAYAQNAPSMYTYGSPFCSYPSETIDPINLVFLSAPSWTDVDSHWGHHLFAWAYSDTDVSQNGLNISSECRAMQAERATDFDYAPIRQHARIMDYGYTTESESLRTGWHVHASAHKEASFTGCIKHSTVEYDATRNDVTNGFTSGGHTLIDWEWWGNIDPQTQCNGEDVASDGYVAYISIGHSGGGIE